MSIINNYSYFYIAISRIIIYSHRIHIIFVVHAHIHLNLVKVVIEIKERYKDAEQLKKYPDIELKVSKYERIKRASKGRAIYYFVLLNETTGYIIDITDINKLKGVNIFNWRIKRTQLDDNSDYVIEPTYSIPVNNAARTIDISKYYKDYYDSNLIEDANNIQTQKEN